MPAVVMTFPFQLYGTWEAQMVRLVKLVAVGLTVRFRIATESQPVDAKRFAEYIPELTIDCPFQV